MRSARVTSELTAAGVKAGAPVAVLGAGSWGTALAIHFARTGRAVRLWGRDRALLESLAARRENERYLAGVPFAKLGLPTLGRQSPATITEGMQHTLYQWMIAPLLAFLGFAFLARRNMTREHADDAPKS